MEAWPYRDFQCISSASPPPKPALPAKTRTLLVHTFPPYGDYGGITTRTRGRCWACRLVHNFRVLRYCNRKLSSLTQMRLYLEYDYFLKMHYLDKTVEYLRDAGSGFPNISDIYSDISSERAWCFERKGVFCCLRPVLPVC